MRGESFHHCSTCFFSCSYFVSFDLRIYFVFSPDLNKEEDKHFFFIFAAAASSSKQQ